MAAMMMAMRNTGVDVMKLQTDQARQAQISREVATAAAAAAAAASSQQASESTSSDVGGVGMRSSEEIDPRLLRRRRGATHSEMSVHKLRLAKVAAEQQYTDDDIICRYNVWLLIVGSLSLCFWAAEFSAVVQATRAANHFRDGTYPPELFFVVPDVALAFEVAYSLLTLTMVFLVYRYYQIMVNIEKRSMRTVTASSNIWRSKFRYAYIFESVICFIQPIPFLTRYPPYWMDPNSEFVNTQVKVGLLMFARLYPAMRVLRDRSLIYQKRREIAKITSTELSFFSSFIVFKASFNHMPALVTVVVTMLGAVVASLSVFAAEWSVTQTTNCEEVDTCFFTFQNAVYMTFVTMTTVGYGDVVAHTNMGKTVAVLTAWFGVLTGSLQVAAVGRRLEMNLQETCSVAWAWTRSYDEQEKVAAARVLQLWWQSVLKSVYGHGYLGNGVLRIAGHEQAMRTAAVTRGKVNLTINDDGGHGHAHSPIRTMATAVSHFFAPVGAKRRRNAQRMRDMFLKKQRTNLKFMEAEQALRMTGIIGGSKGSSNRQQHGPLDVLQERIATMERQQDAILLALKEASQGLERTTGLSCCSVAAEIKAAQKRNSRCAPRCRDSVASSLPPSSPPVSFGALDQKVSFDHRAFTTRSSAADQSPRSVPDFALTPASATRPRMQSNNSHTNITTTTTTSSSSNNNHQNIGNHNNQQQQQQQQQVSSSSSSSSTLTNHHANGGGGPSGNDPAFGSGAQQRPTSTATSSSAAGMMTMMEADGMRRGGSVLYAGDSATSSPRTLGGPEGDHQLQQQQQARAFMLHPRSGGQQGDLRPRQIHSRENDNDEDDDDDDEDDEGDYMCVT